MHTYKHTIHTSIYKYVQHGIQSYLFSPLAAWTSHFVARMHTIYDIRCYVCAFVLIIARAQVLIESKCDPLFNVRGTLVLQSFSYLGSSEPCGYAFRTKLYSFRQHDTVIVMFTYWRPDSSVLSGGVFQTKLTLFVSEGEKSPNGMPLRREREVVSDPFRLERARRRPDPPGELLSGRSHLKWGELLYISGGISPWTTLLFPEASQCRDCEPFVTLVRFAATGLAERILHMKS